MTDTVENEKPFMNETMKDYAAEEESGRMGEIAGSGPVGCTVPSREDALNFMLQYQQLIMLYESAAKCVTMRLEIMKNESKVRGPHTAIRSVTSRIKEPASIHRKLKKMGPLCP